jgi:hypothetical protein
LSTFEHSRAAALASARPSTVSHQCAQHAHARNRSRSWSLWVRRSCSSKQRAAMRTCVRHRRRALERGRRGTSNDRGRRDVKKCVIVGHDWCGVERLKSSRDGHSQRRRNKGAELTYSLTINGLSNHLDGTHATLPATALHTLQLCSVDRMRAVSVTLTHTSNVSPDHTVLGGRERSPIPIAVWFRAIVTPTCSVFTLDISVFL